MENWRFVDIDWLTYADTAILRPVLMKARAENIIPNTYNIFSFSKPSIVLPFFNDPEKDINLDLCRKMGIPVKRIIAPGGPAYGDTGYMFTILVAGRKTPKLLEDPSKMLEKTLTYIAFGLSEYFDVECRFRPVNDIEIKCQDGVWRKIGPSGCLYEEKVIQLTTCIQIKKIDTDLVGSLITQPPEKFIDKETKSVKDRITCLEQIAGRDIDLSEIKKIYKKQFEKIFEVKLVLGKLTEKENIYYKEMKGQYTSDDYFMERSERRFRDIPSNVHRKAVQFKIHGGPFIRIVMLVRDNTIWDIIFSGTIHASPFRPTSPIHEIEKALKSQVVDEKAFESKIKQILNRPGFFVSKITPELLARKIYECATQ